MNFWGIMLFMALAFVIQYIFGIYQIKNFSRSFNNLRSIGKVAIGRYRGKIRAGVIVMFAIDENSYILRAERMQGVTAFAKFKELKGFAGKKLMDLQQNDMEECNPQIKDAILDAMSVYKTVMAREQVLENLSPFEHIGLAVKKGLKAIHTN